MKPPWCTSMNEYWNIRQGIVTYRHLMNAESEEPETDLVEPEDFVDPVSIDEWQVSIHSIFWNYVY